MGKEKKLIIILKKMEKIKKPSAREFQYVKPVCLIEKDDCVGCFEPIDINGRKHNCSNCKIALEHKNKKKEVRNSSQA